ncbi:MAG: thioesterase family protein [Bacteroidota bacterium]|nr:thioesterase family protein [Bacteroidota bacterium]
MDFKNITEGLSNTLETSVNEKDTAATYGSGLLEVYATPAMIAFMENTSLHVVQNKLPEGYNTVGTSVNIKHLKATPVGMKVTCKAKLISVNGSKLEFDLECHDEKGLIGKGTHKRYIINTEEFIKGLK